MYPRVKMRNYIFRSDTDFSIICKPPVFLLFISILLLKTFKSVNFYLICMLSHYSNRSYILIYTNLYKSLGFIYTWNDRIS